MRGSRAVLNLPVVTEKSFSLREKGWYAFSVDEKAKKLQIKESVERMFGVKVSKVRTMVVPGRKTRRMGNRPAGRKPGFKKAYVKVAEGSIEMFEGM